MLQGNAVGGMNIGSCMHACMHARGMRHMTWLVAVLETAHVLGTAGGGTNSGSSMHG
jgi:hypothetical protein